MNKPNATEDIYGWTYRVAEQVRDHIFSSSEEFGGLGEALAENVGPLARALSAADAVSEVFALLNTLRDREASLLAERDEARQLAADLWQGLPTQTKVEIFDRSAGWVPDWVRGPRDRSE